MTQVRMRSLCMHALCHGPSPVRAGRRGRQRQTRLCREAALHHTPSHICKLVSTHMLRQASPLPGPDQCPAFREAASAP